MYLTFSNRAITWWQRWCSPRSRIRQRGPRWRPPRSPSRASSIRGLPSSPPSRASVRARAHESAPSFPPCGREHVHARDCGPSSRDRDHARAPCGVLPHVCDRGHDHDHGTRGCRRLPCDRGHAHACARAHACDHGTHQCSRALYDRGHGHARARGRVPFRRRGRLRRAHGRQCSARVRGSARVRHHQDARPWSSTPSVRRVGQPNRTVGQLGPSPRAFRGRP
mmetsp:Transcript_28291/g.63777  ORF Transcript_28291/g.63777 Transcript_28291/m.63777 type:complete len:223 (+) Transcript_28291:160-828(+)